MMRGPAISVWVKTSGGVKIAAVIKITTSEYLRFFRSQDALIIPILVRIKETVGSSKIRPNAKRRCRV